MLIEVIAKAYDDRWGYISHHTLTEKSHRCEVTWIFSNCPCRVSDSASHTTIMHALIAKPSQNLASPNIEADTYPTISCEWRTAASACFANEYGLVILRKKLPSGRDKHHYLGLKKSNVFLVDGRPRWPRISCPCWLEGLQVWPTDGITFCSHEQAKCRWLATVKSLK